MEIRVGGKYKVCKKLGSGSYGDIYQGFNIKTNEEVGIKLEKLSAETPMLIYESKIYEKFKDEQGFPSVHWTGVEGDYTVMVMDILGPSLNALFEFCDYKFELKTTFWIAQQMLNRIEIVHSKDYIHRDIKPDNFLVGHNKKQEMVYVIDFGLSKRYKCPKTNVHVARKKKNGVTGTPRYCSLNAHFCYEQSRRDDLESIGFVLIYFLNNGFVPWMKAESDKSGSNKEQLAIKNATSIEELCKNQPKPMLQYMKYVRNLKFDQKPNYCYLKQLFEDYLKDNGLEIDESQFDWIVKREQMIIQKLKKMEDQKLNEEQKLQQKEDKKSKPKNKRMQALAEQKRLIELREEEKRRAKEEKKKKKLEMLEEQKAMVSPKEQIERMKQANQIKVRETIEKACKDIENASIPKKKRFREIKKQSPPKKLNYDNLSSDSPKESPARIGEPTSPQKIEQSDDELEIQDKVLELKKIDSE